MERKEGEGAEIFDCTQCGECCKGYGGTYVTDADIRAIANYIGVESEGFRERYCRMSGSRFVIAQGENGYCLFWDGNCSIHPVKPRMCRVWPFISGVLVDVRNWRVMADNCPGMRTDVSDESILDAVRRARGEMMAGPEADPEADPEPVGNVEGAK